MTDSRRSDLQFVLRPAMVGAAFALLLSSAHSSSAHGADNDTRPLSRTKYTNGASVRRVFGDVVTEANDWTVHVKRDGAVVAFGTIVHSDGYIASKASQLTGELVCRLADGRELPATYVGYNSEYDVALLKVQAEGLNSVRWQDEGDPHVGSWVITPDQQGTPRSIGVLSVARRSIPQVKEPAILGIRMKIDASPVVVQAVAEGSAAELAELQPGDIIHEVDDVAVTTPERMKKEISRRAPGDTISLKIERDGERRTLRATLTHPFGDFESRIAMQNHMGGPLSQRRTGFAAVLQHDSVLQPDECGGPLLDLSGRAIGINIARAGRTETYAIPDDVVRPLIDDLLTGHHPPPGERQPTVAAGVTDGEPAPPEMDTSRH